MSSRSDPIGSSGLDGGSRLTRRRSQRTHAVHEASRSSRSEERVRGDEENHRPGERAEHDCHAPATCTWGTDRQHAIDRAPDGVRHRVPVPPGCGRHRQADRQHQGSGETVLEHERRRVADITVVHVHSQQPDRERHGGDDDDSQRATSSATPGRAPPRSRRAPAATVRTQNANRQVDERRTDHCQAAAPRAGSTSFADETRCATRLSLPGPGRVRSVWARISF